MMNINPISLYSISFALAFVSFYVLTYFRTRHLQNRCPQSYPIVGNLLGFLRNLHRFHDWVGELLSSSDSLTIQVNGFLGLSHGICTADPANIEHLLCSSFSNYIKGTRFKSGLDELLGNGIFNVDGELWLAQRKISSHEFNTKSLKRFIADIVESQLSNRLIPYLSSICDSGRVIDLQHVLQRFTFDNMCNVAFGVDPACLVDSEEIKTSSNSLFVRAFDYAVETSSNRLMHPFPLMWRIKRRLNIGSEKKFKEAIQIINDYALRIIQLKEQNQEGSQDLLSRFMNSSSTLKFHDEDEQRKFLRDIVISFILAGKDSTSTALTWFFWLISGHPHCERAIHNELSSSSPGTLSFDKMKDLNYLHAALTESLRLFPPVPINSRLTASSTTLPDGTYIGKGWFADYSAYAMGRMERVWGADCREFRPERWLDGNGVFRPCDHVKFPVFHCGPRMCLGKEMAYVQMKYVAAAVMSEFEVVAVDGGGCPVRMAEPPYILSLQLKMKGGLPVELRRRRK
ncbi:cytochrome P450 94A1-like [Andrographis paniculata]|uniref:cytochrome P450 94A1-like n=1 Tax=Andrographis paniculata TaxID=175694 RepID=UPI0021E94ADD|nr:cytochrome P450 94A1-like [Andrographis paniculata]XP_051143118.1 cytochrome P450 94A1-like [Andrographis paniculata]